MKGTVARSLTVNYMLFGWVQDLFYMDKTFDEAMAKRGFANTTIRNSKGE